jgi:hypothetical protein
MLPEGFRDRAYVEMTMTKNHTLNWFYSVPVRMAGGSGLQDLKMLATEYVPDVRDRTGNVYQGRADYVSDGALGRY